MRETLLQAMQFFEQGQLQDAEAAAREALALLPADPPAARLLGLLAAARQDFAAARAWLQPICAEYDTDPMLQTALAEALWATRSVEAAIPLLRHVLHLDPSRHRVRARLGAALLQTGQPAAARTELARALRARPDEAAWHLQLGLALRDLGDLAAAIDSMGEAVRLGLHTAPAYVALGDALLDAGDPTSALAALATAAQCDPRSHVAWMLLGRAAGLTGQGERAVSCFRRALEVVPEDGIPTVLAALANALHAAGQTAEAEQTFARLMRSAERRPPRRKVRQRRVGVLAAPGAANTPSEFLLDRTALSVEPVFIIDSYDYSVTRLHARFDVLFNAISDPDEARLPLRRAGELCARIARPLINPPGAVWATTRDAMAARLADLPGAIIPRTWRCRRIDLLQGAPRDLRFPLLLRPLGSHGGNSLSRLDDPAAMHQSITTLTCETVYLTEYHDFRSADGLWRKYRVIFVGGQVFPYHLGIGHGWLNHYFRTATNREDALHAEETHFLQQPAAVLGPLAMAALAALPGRVGLDYFGVDFALDREGRLILFECNAAMRVRGARGGEKARAAERIRDAMTARLLG